ncbi:U2 snRNP-associated SURP motif-containing protein [Sarcoptes scabiei]|uniref:U2 snRNP-associated SURP motif-containing protein n=1 Tax=Sarcoptes scabiei TaxID=52283 RepID=A0A834R9Q6_SARSC|nr:U2 snRNP-associated SURP motif-containing protein [Sarcoptes scabiei]
MKSFALNAKKKKDLEKQKKQAEEEACAEAYEEFVATFNAPKPQSKLFVRGNVINPSSGQELSAGHSGKLYKPEKLQELESKRSNKSPSDHHSRSSSSFSSRYNDKPPKKNDSVKKKSNLEIFKEELKREQAQREERIRQRNNLDKLQNEKSTKSSSTTSSSSSTHKSSITSLLDDEPNEIRKSGGSHDTGDPNTTNVYLGNLSPKITEKQLCEIFGRYGPLASVKIMWPRTEEERIRNRNCGFVAFMCRKDGERALKALNGRNVMDYEMRLSWGKAVPIPPTPVYIPACLRELTLPPPQSGLPFNAQIVEEKDRKTLEKYGNDPQQLFRENREAFDDLLSRTLVKVTIPQERNLVTLIHRVVEFVVREGPMFEALLMTRELNNPMYNFLFKNQSPQHVYYRWRLFSVLQGEHPSRWRTEDFRMFVGGSLWRPPPINLYHQGMPEHLLPKDEEFQEKYDPPNEDSFEEEYESNKGNRQDTNRPKGHLNNEDREEFEVMLRALTPQRSSIGQMMMFCIEHADSWEEIVEGITDSLCISETPLYKKIARLFLISDILHNCSVKVANVSNYRKSFQAKFNEIFDSFRQCYNQIDGRLKAEHFKQRVMNCFRAWEEMAIYSSDFLIKLQSKFLGLSESDSNQSSKQSNRNVTKKSSAEDLDGEPMIDPDLDGIEMVEDKTNHRKQLNSSKSDEIYCKKFKASKWETVNVEQEQQESQSSLKSSKWESEGTNQDIFDDEDDEHSKSFSLKSINDYADDEDDDIDGQPLDDEVYLGSILAEKNSPSTTTNVTKTNNNQLSRETLREIEIKVMKFQDDFENGIKSNSIKLNPDETISKLVENYRKKLSQEHLQQQQQKKQSSSSSSSASSSTHHDSSSRKRSRSISRSPSWDSKIRDNQTSSRSSMSSKSPKRR